VRLFGNKTPGNRPVLQYLLLFFTNSCLVDPGFRIARALLLPKISSLVHGLKKGSNLVLESNEAFNRTIYHLHQELELTELERKLEVRLTK
jgi:hypothetical protein